MARATVSPTERATTEMAKLGYVFPCAGSSAVEQEPFKLVVAGSIPARRTKNTCLLAGVFAFRPGERHERGVCLGSNARAMFRQQTVPRRNREGVQKK